MSLTPLPASRGAIAPPVLGLLATAFAFLAGRAWPAGVAFAWLAAAAACLGAAAALLRPRAGPGTDAALPAREALRHTARMAAVNATLARMSHDLRGILSSALLVADRLTMSREPSVQNAGEVIVRAVHRATALTQRTLDVAREGAPRVQRAQADVGELLDQAAAAVALPAWQLRSQVLPGTLASVDADAVRGALIELFRNAAASGARHTYASRATPPTPLALVLRDDGPGLPEPLRDAPFTRTPGLGLPIARDLVRGSGGDLRLTATDRGGTSFCLYLQHPEEDQA